jgi:phenylacetate-CoA ligase
MLSERPYWNMDVEPLLNTPQIRDLQLERLRKQLCKLKANAPHYARMMEKNRFDPEKLRSFEEFKDKIDVFTKATWREIVEECDGNMLKAIRQRIAVDLAELAWIPTTSGSTGVPTPYPMTDYDMREVWSEFTARGCWRSGIRSGDRILLCFALSMVIAGVPNAIAFQRVGATVLPVGAEAKSERILFMQNLFQATVYVGTPSLAEYLIEQSPKLLHKEAKELGIRILVCGAEPGAGIPEVRAKLQQNYDAKLFDAGAGFGFSCDHEEYQGMHWLMNDLSYYELVDPETKAPIPFEHGAQGEGLLTLLTTDGLISVRESPGDMVQVFTDPCPCGRTGFRYKVIGRCDDMLKVKGIMVYPSHLKGVINQFVPRVTGEMRIILDDRPPRVVPPLKLRIEYGKGVGASELQILEKQIIESMSDRLKITPKILWAEPGSLERSHYKGKVFEEAYKQST